MLQASAALKFWSSSQVSAASRAFSTSTASARSLLSHLLDTASSKSTAGAAASKTQSVTEEFLQLPFETVKTGAAPVQHQVAQASREAAKSFRTLLPNTFETTLQKK